MDAGIKSPSRGAEKEATFDLDKKKALNNLKGKKKKAIVP